MGIFKSLFYAANDSGSLESYIQKNYDNIVLFFSNNVNSQRSELDDFEQFVLSKSVVIENLNYAKSFNRAFVYYLMEYCERFCSISAIVQLYRIIQDNKLTIGSRLEAAMLYLYNVPSNDTYIDRFGDICSNLQIAINNEDDDDKKAIASFLNYYSYVVYNTSLHYSESIFLKYTEAVDAKLYPFLTNDIVKECISLDFHNTEVLFHTIQNKIDELLGRTNKIVITTTNESEFLIEKNTDYVDRLKNAPHTFQAIRDISVKLVNQYENKDEIFYSLGRGVTILKEYAQLCSYINSYGNMHEAKMISALESLPFEQFNNRNVEIFDWGCGQGLASVVLYNYFRKMNFSINVKRVILIEPSILALKRAALHVRHFDEHCVVKTILKDFDSILTRDIVSDAEAIKIHLFSNVLDVDAFSLQELISKITQTQKRSNYFVCVSPLITEEKTARIDSFVRYFKSNHSSYFHSYVVINNQKGEWKNGWTRVIRVFRVEL